MIIETSRESRESLVRKIRPDIRVMSSFEYTFCLIRALEGT